MPTAPRIGTIIAERRLVARDGGVVRVAIGVPRRRNEADWACPLRIHGAGVTRVEYGCGVDSMQALATALEGIRVVLDETGLSLGWDMGRGDVYEETGFTRSIPITWSPAVRKLLERLVDRELQRELRALERRGRRRRKAAKAR
jgi:hypothetical protein